MACARASRSATTTCTRWSGPPTVAALLITREQAVTAVENKYQGDFLRDLLLRRAGDPAYVAEHAETFGWDLDRPVVVVAAEIDPADEPVSSAQRRQWQERFSAAWRQVADARRRRGSRPSTSPPRWSPCSRSPRAPDLGDDVVRRVVTAVAGDKGGGRRPFSVGVSRVAAVARRAARRLRPGPAGGRGRPPGARRRVDDVLRPARRCTG